MNPAARALAAALLRVDRIASSARVAHEIVRDELMLALVPPAERATFTAAVYAGEPGYAPGGRLFDGGLHRWEADAFAHRGFPKRGSVLVGGAGAGREVRSLVDRGLDVIAFDPCAEFLPSLQAIASERPSSRAFVASFEHLIEAVRAGGGPLAAGVRGRSFDAVLLGWGSLSHVRGAGVRAALFEVLAEVCPSGPILTSFVPLGAAAAAEPARVRAARRLRAALGWLGGNRAEESERFAPHVGFFEALAEEELEELARRCRRVRMTELGFHDGRAGFASVASP